jgi:hypothetical protein
MTIETKARTSRTVKTSPATRRRAATACTCSGCVSPSPTQLRAQVEAHIAFMHKTKRWEAMYERLTTPRTSTARKERRP